ncbi:MAG: hypothetical protein PHC50_07270 [Candidatus Cloacimonetes bacterium]|nr:hypothetical protein [Candidatus Cloacimonadota bacterium]
MFWYPLLLGIVASFSPFLGMIGMMIYLGKSLAPALLAPWNMTWPVFIAPLMFLVASPHLAGKIVALDAIIGVGVVSYVFLAALRRNQVLNHATLVSILIIAIYSMLRGFLFRDVLIAGLAESSELMQTQFPALFNEESLEFSTKLWKLLLPSSWGLGQIFAFLIGQILFHKALKLPVLINDMRFPALYNLLILAILPLYFIEAGHYFFINALILLCVVPFLQGISAFSRTLKRVFSNGIIRGILMAITILYAFIPLILIGFADSWMHSHTKLSGGNTA